MQLDNSFGRRYDGTGLGLPTTKALIELHDGVLKLKSAVGVGTEATVMFPSRRAVRAEAAAAAA